MSANKQARVWAVKWIPSGCGGWNIARRMKYDEAVLVAFIKTEQAKERGMNGRCDVIVSDDVPQ